MDERISAAPERRQRFETILRWLLLIAAVLIVVLLACSLFIGWLQRFAALRAFSYVVERLTEESSWDPNLIKAGVVVLMVPYVLAVSRLARPDLPILRWFWSKPQMSKGLAQAIVAAGLCSYFLALYFAGRGSNLHRWYVIDADYHVHYAHHGGVDSHTLMPLQSVTAAIVPVLDRIEGGERPKDISGEDPTQMSFFSPATPTALVWYCERRSGGRAFFNLPGFDRLTGTPLMPVNEAVVNDWIDRWSRRNPQRPAEVPPPRRSSPRAADTGKRPAREPTRRAAKAPSPEVGPGSPEAAVRGFLSAAHSSDFAAAYGYLHTTLKENCTPQRFISLAIAGKPRLLDIHGTSLDRTSFGTGGAVTLSGTVTLDNGTQLPASFTLLREGSAWRLVSYSVGA